MKHGTMLITIALLFSGVSLAQERVARPALRTGDGILGPQLIAWSEMQKPQPVPQRPEPVPVPDSNADKQAGPTEDTPKQHPAPDTRAPAQEKQGPAAQTLSGTVIKLGNKYVLKTTDKQTYELDDQDKAREYEGKQVKIVGSLDRTTNMIHITSIELVS
ncbi:MAG: hypothetical protein DMG76_26070 [Acidobacteria bacterium]|jgi:uncharacterized protein DUF5818|nr:MAG: hypothetical protein DMG76_26070 [Acidobacteriota bacterium]